MEIFCFVLGNGDVRYNETIKEFYERLYISTACIRNVFGIDGH